MTAFEVHVERIGDGAREAFARLHSGENGHGWCRCVAWWVPGWEGWGERGAEQNAALREELFARGERDGYLAFHGDEPVGWCQVAPRDHLPGVVHDFGASGEPDVWAVSCFFVAPPFRGRGVARALLVHALEELTARGARALEAFPRSDGATGEGEVWTGPPRLFEDLGFVERTAGPRRSVVRLELGAG